MEGNRLTNRKRNIHDAKVVCRVCVLRFADIQNYVVGVYGNGVYGVVCATRQYGKVVIFVFVILRYGICTRTRDGLGIFRRAKGEFFVIITRRELSVVLVLYRRCCVRGLLLRMAHQEFVQFLRYGVQPVAVYLCFVAVFVVTKSFARRVCHNHG